MIRQRRVAFLSTRLVLLLWFFNWSLRVSSDVPPVVEDNTDTHTDIVETPTVVADETAAVVTQPQNTCSSSPSASDLPNSDDTSSCTIVETNCSISSSSSSSNKKFCSSSETTINTQHQPPAAPAAPPPPKSSTPPEKQQQQQQQTCGLYLARSTIPGAGLGAFTGIDRSPHDVIGTGDVMVPIYDVEYHLQRGYVGTKEGEESSWTSFSQRKDYDTIDPTRDYVWYGFDLGMQYESSHPYTHVSGIAYGLDAAINCHLALFNAEKEYPTYDFANLHRSIDPGIGAFTPYHNASTWATRRIVAGSELFKSYGNQWFTDRVDTFGLVPLTNDYTVVESMLRNLQQIFVYGKVRIDIRRDMYESLIVSNPYVNQSRTLRAIPELYDDFQYIVQRGIRAYHQQNATVSIEYLQQHGRCVDTIQPQPSTLRQAGRGAFATRSIAKDTIVIGTPFFYYASDDFFRLYPGNWYTKDVPNIPPGDDHPEPIGYQLMYNYCFRHEKNISSIVLCPYGMNVNYINHNQSLVNVRLQWAQNDGEMNHNTTLLRTHPREMYYSDAPKLWMDYVATRDIEVGEEIFMDYGTVWEEAWQRHAATWNNDRVYPTDYISASDWNKINAKAKLRTKKERIEEPYPNHFIMICLPEIADPNYNEILTSAVCESTWNPNVFGLHCRVHDREQQSDGSYWYTVQYKNAGNSTWVESEWIVREAIRFVNKAYTNDIHLKDAFRQSIGIPDDIFPNAWRDIHLPPLPPKG